MQAYFCPADYKRGAGDDLHNFIQHKPNQVQGYILAFRLAALKIEKTMDDELFNVLQLVLSPISIKEYCCPVQSHLKSLHSCIVCRCSVHRLQWCCPLQLKLWYLYQSWQRLCPNRGHQLNYECLTIKLAKVHYKMQVL